MAIFEFQKDFSLLLLVGHRKCMFYREMLTPIEVTIFCLSSLLYRLRIACLARTKEVLTEHCGMKGCVYNTPSEY